MSATKTGSTIDATHGMKGETYTLPASCLNCGWYGHVKRLLGTSCIGTRFRCPTCGCSEVSASRRAFTSGPVVEGEPV